VATDTVKWTFTDHLGAPVVQTNNTGAVTWRVEREPYGETFAIRAGSDQHQPLGFPGQEEEQLGGGVASSDRRYNIFRWYRAGWGGYTQSDPVGSRYATHLYLYATARPITRIDPLGLFEVDPNCTGCGPTNMAPDLGNSIRRQTTTSCEAVDSDIKDVALADCIKGKCRTARITCIDPDGYCDKRPEAGGYAPYGGNEVTLCTGNWLPFWGGIIGDMVIHEFAHLCNWCHGDPGGVPFRGQADDSCWRDW
jgi:RHS repeat-associated protein